MQHNSGGGDIPHVTSGTELSVTAAGTPTAAITAANGAAQQQMNGAVASQLLNTSDPAIRADILKMIVQYLENERLFNAAAVLQDEANMRAADVHAKRSQSSRLRKAIFDGDWEGALKLIARVAAPSEQKKLQYYLHRQEYLELIDRQEFQRAFGVLTKRLKPLEEIANASAPSEFQELCYLLTCSSVHDTKLFKGWGGITAGRESLAERVAMAIDTSFVASSGTMPVPANRLVTLLQQAATYQVEHCHPKPLVPPVLTTLLTDFQPVVLPNATMHVCAVKDAYTTIVHSTSRSLLSSSSSVSDLESSSSNDGSVLRFHSQGGARRRGHAAVKCAEFIADTHGRFPVVAGGATDGSVYFWLVGSRSASCPQSPATVEAEACDTWPAALRLLAPSMSREDDAAETTVPSASFSASSSTVWDLCSTRTGSVLITAAGDGKVVAWKARHVHPARAPPADDPQFAVHASIEVGGEHRTRVEILRYELGSHRRDAYCVAMHPDDAHVVSGGYDRVVHMYSLKSGEEIKTCTGHSAPVTQVAFNPYGNLAISSSRDGTMRFWDCLSGVCVRTLEEPLGEITSVNINDEGSNLLVCARFGAPRILDARTGNTVTRFASHGPLSTGSMYRPTFAAGDTVVLSGSDDGVVVAWDAATGQPIRRLAGHTAPVTRTVWFAPMSLLASVSLDSTLRVWHWDPAQEPDRGDRSPSDGSSL